MGKIFVNYRREDERAMAARVRDRLAQTFGNRNVFMDVDHLMAGLRFDHELEKALAETDVFLAVIGPQWMELLEARRSSGERDYVHEEIAGALKAGIVVIPVLIDGAPLPSAEALPEDLRELVLHQKHDVTHERFGRDMTSLIEAIRYVRKRKKAEVRGDKGAVSAGRLLAGLALLAVIGGGGVFAYTGGFGGLMGSIGTPAPKSNDDAGRRAALAKAEADKKAKEAAKRAAEDEAKKERLALLEKQRRREAEEARKQAEAEAKRKTEEERRRREPALTAKPGSGETFRDCLTCPEMVVVPKGSFMMGSPKSEKGRSDDEGPQRRVNFAMPFAVGKFEVTWDEWDACVSDGGCDNGPVKKAGGDNGWGKGRRPVIEVDWNDAKAYAAWLSKKTGKPYRLLTEAEWEYAARAGTTTRYHFGDDQDNLCNFANVADKTAKEKNPSWSIANCRDGYVNTSPVGSFKPNNWGLHDMNGNVWEWVEDCWNDSYKGAPTDGSGWAVGDCSRRVVRGGSWDVDPRGLRSAYRDRSFTVIRDYGFGFRLGRTLTP